MESRISGLGVALVTPFGKDGEVDYPALGRVVDFVIEGGVDYLVVLGTTGETPTLKPHEKTAIVEFVKERNVGRLPIVVGCGGNDTGDVCGALREADFDGVETVLSVAPYYNKPSQEGLYRHFRSVAESSKVPIIIYNIPARTGVNMTSETILRIARGGNVAGVKEACGMMGQMMELLCGRPEGLKVLSGDDMLAVPLMAVGGDGVISVAANAFPAEMAAMVRAAGEGDFSCAGMWARRLFPVFEAMFSEGNPTGVKCALAARGIIGPDMRLPMVPGSERLQAFFKEYMA